VLVFLLVLGVGLAYVWARGDLRWTSVKPGRAVSDEALVRGVDREPEIAAPQKEAS
jgi:hypothetical protein